MYGLDNGSSFLQMEKSSLSIGILHPVYYYYFFKDCIKNLVRLW